MIKISPFTPLFFSPSSDKFGAESRYIQLFAPTDNIFIEVITTTEYKMNGLLKIMLMVPAGKLSFNPSL